MLGIVVVVVDDDDVADDGFDCGGDAAVGARGAADVDAVAGHVVVGGPRSTRQVGAMPETQEQHTRSAFAFVGPTPAPEFCRWPAAASRGSWRTGC